MTLPISYLKINDNIAEIEAEKEIQAEETIKEKDVIFDFDKGEFVYNGLEPSRTYDKIEIIKQWIKSYFTLKEIGGTAI